MLPLKSANDRISRGWQYVSRECLPFADAASTELPLGRLLRLSLFQVTVGMATALLVGTLNRVMIVELGVSAWLVSLMIALPLLFAPFRALVGFKSDTHRSILGWRRVPYIWFGSLIQFGGLAIMPFALLILSGDSHGPIVVGHIGAALAFLMIGAGLHTTQTAGLALATDLAPPESRPRVVALMYVMLLVGLVLSSFAFSYFLENFSAIRLIKVIQGAAVITMVLNVVALWKQEPRIPWQTRAAEEKSPTFVEVWQIFRTQPGAIRMLAAVGFGTAA
ncbi:MAG: MFS transporter, partial [Rhodocyclaceae bacterium]|nr:MFS transporter [Rhodocyclaceae bacterium]